MNEEPNKPLFNSDDRYHPRYPSFDPQYAFPPSDRVRSTNKGNRKRNKVNKNRKIKLLIKEEFKCHYCKTEINIETVSIDHKVPRSNGGSNDLGNLLASCYECNNKKGSESYEDFMNKQLGLFNKDKKEVNILLIYNEIPESLQIYKECVTKEEFAKLIKCHNKFLGTDSENGFQENLLFMEKWRKDKSSVYNDENASNQHIHLEGIYKVIVTGVLI